MSSASFDPERIRVLLVEDNPLDAHLVQAILRGADIPVHIELAGTLAEASALLADGFDVVLLDLALPDAHGLEALRVVRARASETPVVVLTGSADKDVALQAVRDGAQDYLTKERMEGDVLLRALRYAIERHRLLAAIRDLSLRDQLTGLYNRHGFFTLAEQHVRVAFRNQQRLGVFYADIDGLKQINDRLGHRTGDRAIQEAADVLRTTFRDSDILSRIGGDEFVMFALPMDEEGVTVTRRRIRETLADLNAVPPRAYRLSLSIGVTLCDAAERPTVDQLLGYADASMYSQKRTTTTNGDAGTPSEALATLE